MSRRQHLIFGVIALSAVAALTAGLHYRARASVEGDTAQERVACIARIADERPTGAARAIAAAALGDSDAVVRRAALVAMGGFGISQGRPVAERAARDPSPQVRAEAAHLLGTCGDAAAADRLHELAGSDPAESVRLAAVAALGRAPAAKSVVGLVEIAETSENPVVRAGAMEALCRRFGVPRTFDPSDTSKWDRDLEVIKSWPKVQAAFAASSLPLRRRPELLPQMPH